jgi:hypothetical protein
LSIGDFLAHRGFLPCWNTFWPYALGLQTLSNNASSANHRVYISLTVGTSHALRLRLIALQFKSASEFLSARPTDGHLYLLYSTCHASRFTPRILGTLSLGRIQPRRWRHHVVGRHANVVMRRRVSRGMRRRVELCRHVRMGRRAEATMNICESRLRNLRTKRDCWPWIRNRGIRCV